MPSGRGRRPRLLRARIARRSIPHTWVATTPRSPPSPHVENHRLGSPSRHKQGADGLVSDNEFPFECPVGEAHPAMPASVELEWHKCDKHVACWVLTAAYARRSL